MNTQDTGSTDKAAQVISKQVRINGQLVTLYSLNGQTWLSSPDQLPEVMARLESARVLLNDPKAAEVAKEKEKDKDKEKEKEKGQNAPRPAAAARYRMKGPKPRPHLNQDGRVITDTTVVQTQEPLAPIHAAAMAAAFKDANAAVKHAQKRVVPLLKSTEAAKKKEIAKAEKAAAKIKAAEVATAKAAQKASKKAAPKPAKKAVKAAPAKKVEKKAKKPVAKAAAKKAKPVAKGKKKR